MNHRFVWFAALFLPSALICQQSDSVAKSIIFKNADSLFVSFRFPDHTDSSEDWTLFQKEHGHLPIVCSGDFNGDSQLDFAFIALSKDSNQKYGVYCLLSVKQDSFQLITLEEGTGYPLSLGIEVAAPGPYRTAAGKGYWEPGPDEPLQLYLNHSAIDLFIFESANSFFVWNPKKKMFDRVWMSD